SPSSINRAEVTTSSLSLSSGRDFLGGAGGRLAGDPIEARLDSGPSGGRGAASGTLGKPFPDVGAWSGGGPGFCTGSASTKPRSSFTSRIASQSGMLSCQTSVWRSEEHTSELQSRENL